MPRLSLDGFGQLDFPEELTANAWTGSGPLRGRLSDRAPGWALGQVIHGEAGWMRPPPPADPRDWRDERVGWGVVLRDDPTVPESARGRVDDAPEPIRELVSERGGKVLRWAPSNGPLVLSDYAAGGHVPLSGAPEGMADGALPRYLLLAGGPDVLPWDLQYALNAGNYVGRLHLTGAALERYVAAAVSDWTGSAASYATPVVWSADFGGADITALMRAAIAVPVAELIGGDADMPGARFLDGAAGPATAAALADALADGTPAVVVTTSHGMTGPVTDPPRMLEDLGLPVDQLRGLVRPDELLGRWDPDGAIWYSHACCSAGTDGHSVFAELFTPGQEPRPLLEALASIGPAVAPLPTALLGAPRPLRAFIGQVEPTFDWTIRFPWTRMHLTTSITSSLYEGLCAGEPVGFALRRVWAHVGELSVALQQAEKLVDAGRASAGRGLSAALYCQLAARDRGSTVVLGDPAVALPVPEP